MLNDFCGRDFFDSRDIIERIEDLTDTAETEDEEDELHMRDYRRNVPFEERFTRGEVVKSDQSLYATYDFHILGFDSALKPPCYFAYCPQSPEGGYYGHGVFVVGQRMGPHVIVSDPRPTVTIDGKTYHADEVAERVRALTPVEED